MAEKVDKSQYIWGHFEHLQDQITICQNAIDEGKLYPGFLGAVQRVYRFSGLSGPTSFDTNRFIVRGNVASVLPEDFTQYEKLEAESITEQAAESVRKLTSKQGLKSYKKQPLTTVFIRDCKEQQKVVVPTRPQMSGIISITMPLFFNTYNMEAAKFARTVYGSEIGRKISQFSFEHELGHQVFSQNSAANNTNFSETEVVDSWYQTYSQNELYWELWANQVPNQNDNLKINGEYVFPNYIARQGENLNIAGETIYQAKHFGVIAENHSSRYPPPHNDRTYPFVMDPADAQEYLAVEKHIQKTKDPQFSWLH